MSVVYSPFAFGTPLKKSVAAYAIFLLLALAPLAGAQQMAERNTEDSSAHSRLETASRLVDAHELEKAESEIKNLLDRNPNDAGALTLLGKIRLEQHGFDDAMVAFESALKTEPRNPAARSGEAKAGTAAALQAKRAGDNDGALVYLIRARKYVPDDPELLFDFGVHADLMHLYKDAEEALTKSLDLRPGDTQTIYALSRLELDEQKMPQAEAHLRQYLKLRPEDASAHYGLGKLLHILLRDDEAQVELRRSVELQPLQTESYYELGDIELQRHKDDAAAALFSKVLGRSPKHGGGLTGLGIIAYRAKDYSKAENYLKSAVLYAQKYPAAHYYYGLVLAKTGRAAEAQAELDRAKSAEEQEKQEQRGFVLSTSPPSP
jgi:tetratricopeptide (TPR) repeat protein